MHCNMFSNIPWLNTLDASNNSPHLPTLPTLVLSQCDRQKCVQTFQVSLAERVFNITPRWNHCFARFF